MSYTLYMEKLVGSTILPDEAEIPDGATKVGRRIADRLATLRAQAGWSLQSLAHRTGISRATLSRLERCELSPSAAMLGALCGQYGWSLSRLMAEAEEPAPSVVRANAQVTWRDPETGYVRRVLSPPHPKLRGELVEVTLPPGSSVAYDASYFPGLEHHLWVLEGSLTLDLDGKTFCLEKGDCIRFVFAGPSRFVGGQRRASYVIALVHP